jgi:urease accessory protein
MERSGATGEMTAGSVVLQRASGLVRVAFKLRGTATVLDRLHQAGIAKARLPDPGPGRPTEAVLLNTAGGLTDGDRLDIELAFGPGTRAVVTTQAAEKVYRARQGQPATVTARIAMAADATAEWLPQETILFDRAALDRRLEVDLHPSSSFLGLEALVFGRQAMGETVRAARLIDRWRIRRGGRLIFADALALDGDIAAAATPRAALGDARAVALLLLAAPDAEARLPAVRDLVATFLSEAGASAWNGMLAVRLLARDPAMLRADLVGLLTALRGPLPRVWMC